MDDGNVTELRPRTNGTIPKGKYVVFKEEEFYRVLHDTHPGRAMSDFAEAMLPANDTFVIRGQDVFGEVALYAYASALHSAASVMEDLGQAEEAADLLRIADVAAERADAARAQKGKLPS